MATATKNAAKTNGFENPYREGGNYHACVQALYMLGVGKFHHVDGCIDLVMKLMGKETNRTKALTNLQVICRTRDFGRSLLEAGMIAKKERNDKGQFFGLFPFNGRMPAQADWMTAEAKPKKSAKPKAKAKKKAAK